MVDALLGMRLQGREGTAVTSECKHTHITLDYFREDGGKWYSQGEHAIFYENDKPVPFWECTKRIQEMLDRGERPGLVNGYGFNVLVTVYGEFGPMQWLIVPYRGKDRNEPERT